MVGRDSTNPSIFKPNQESMNLEGFMTLLRIAAAVCWTITCADDVEKLLSDKQHLENVAGL
jgi:hypothetical protein